MKNDLISEGIHECCSFNLLISNFQSDVRNSLEQIFSKIFSKEVCDQSKYFQPLLNASYELAIDSIVKVTKIENLNFDN